MSPGGRRGWRPSPVVISLTLGATAVVLGLWGVSRVPGQDLSPSDTLYRTVQLFYVKSEVPAAGTPWQLDLARFLAPIVVIYSVLAAVIALTRERIRRWFLWRFGAGHVLVVGLGTRGFQLARALRSTGGPTAEPGRGEVDASEGRRPGLRRRLQRRITGDVVALELDGSSGAARSLRRTGITVITGDARDPETLIRCNATRAAEIALLTGSDTVNLESLAALRGVLDAEDEMPVQVAIDDPAVWAALHRVPFDRDGAVRRVRFVSVPDRSARLLVDAAEENEPFAEPRRRIVIWGLGPTVARLTIHALRSSLLIEGGEIVLAGADASDNLAIVAAIDSWALERAQISIAAGPDSWAGAEIGFVCGLAEAEALAATSMLAGRLAGGAHTYVAVPDADAGEALLAAGVALSRAHLIPISESLYGHAWVGDSALDQLARARHELYRRRRAKSDERSREDPSMLPWTALSEDLRAANHAFAVGVVDRLGRTGAYLAPLAGREAGGLPLDEATIERLAIGEHERWMAERQRRGWRHGSHRDDERKLHPSLVDWEELSPAEREKDFEAIRELPAMLAVAGYELAPGEEGSRRAP